MTRASLYSGPGKVLMSTVPLFPQGESGTIKLDVEQEKDSVASGMHGQIDYTSADVTLKLGITPLDRWGVLALLYPTVFKTPAIGSREPVGADVPCKVWTPDGRLYTLTSAFVSKPPELHLGVGTPLFGPAEITGVIGDDMEMGDAGAFYTLDTAEADPGGPMAMTDSIRESWVGVLGEVAGFDALQAEDEFTITSEIKWKPLKVQKLTRAFELISVAYMVKCRPVGPTQQEIDDLLGMQNGGLLGRRFGASGSALVLTGQQSGKTITLGNTSLVTGGYEFGGSKLGNGEIGFVTGLTFTTGAANPLIVFSA